MLASVCACGVLRMDVHRHPFRTGLTEVRLWGLGGGRVSAGVCVCVEGCKLLGMLGDKVCLQMCVLEGCCGWMCTDTHSGQG